MMPKRPRQHQIEDISRAQFSLLLPDRWVDRPVSHDYGIDCEVEIFDEDEQATGLSFLIQLKASESSDEAKRRSVTLKTDSIRYFLSRQTPVLIARYDVVNDIFYCRWAGHIEFHKIRQGSKSHTFTFGKDEVLTKDTSAMLERDVRISQKFRSGRTLTSVSTKLDIDDSLKNAPVIRNSIRRHLSGATNNAISITQNENYDIRLVLRKKFIRASIGTDTCCEIEFEKGAAKLNLETELNPIALGVLCFSPCRVGRDDLAARLVLSVGDFPIESLPEGLAFKLLMALLNASHHEDAFALIERLPIDEEWMPSASGFMLAALLASRYVPATKRQLLTDFLESRIEGAKAYGTDQSVGIAHYNLANHFKSNRMYRLAVQNYRLAVKFAPEYAGKDYFYSEMGGALFSSRRYRCAAEAYKQAWRLRKSDQIGLLYADSLMMAGDYEAALNQFVENCQRETNRCAEWGLKIYVLEKIVKVRGIEKQKRKIHEAQLASSSGDDLSREDYISNYWKVFQLDALSPRASFNYAVSLAERRQGLDHPDWEEAYFGFVVAALICTNDVESWTNCVTCITNHKELWPHLILVVEAAYFFMGDEFLFAVTDKLHAAIGGEVAKGVVAGIEEIVEASKETHQDEVRLRLLNDAGEVEKYADLMPN